MSRSEKRPFELVSQGSVEAGKGPVSAPDVVTVDPDPEVLAKAKRRTFTAEYKLRILDEVDRALTARLPGRVGQILRREGLYSSHLAEWRRDRRQGALASMAEKRRGRKATQRRDEAAVEIARLRKENARLQQRLAQAETIIEVQKKLSVILGIPLKPMELGDSDGSNDDSDGSDE